MTKTPTMDEIKKMMEDFDDIKTDENLKSVDPLKLVYIKRRWNL